MRINAKCTTHNPSLRMRRTIVCEILSYKRIKLMIVSKKRAYWTEDFTVPTDHSVKLKNNEQRNKYQNLARELNKTMEHVSDCYTICNWCAWYSNEMFGTRTRGLGNKRKSEEHQNYSIVEFSQNSKKSPGDLRRFNFTQTLVDKHHLTLVWKTLKWVKQW